MVNRVVQKALAGVEDLLLGTGTVTQARNGSDKVITKIDASGLLYENAETLRTRLGKKLQTIDTIADMQALATDTVEEQYLDVLGYSTPGDGGGGVFWLDTTDTTSVEDLKLVFNPDILANGRWKRAHTTNQLSSDRGDADYTIKAYDYGIQLYSTALTANRTVLLPTTGLYNGKRVSVLRTALGAYNLLLGSVAILTGSGLVELQYDDGSWAILTSPTSLSAGTDSFNGSFEVDTNNDSQPDNWELVPLAAAVIAIDSTSSVHGINSLQFLSGGSGGGSATSKRFDVISGSNFGMVFRYKSSSATSLTKIVVNTYDRAGLLLSELLAFSEGVNNPATFTKQIASAVLDATAVTAEIVLTGVDATGTTTSAATTTHFENLELGVPRFFETDFVILGALSLYDFDNIPVWATRITIKTINVQTSTADAPIYLRLKNSGVLVTSGYDSRASQLGTGGTTQINSSIGMLISSPSTGKVDCTFVLTKLDSRWHLSGVGISNSMFVAFSHGTAANLTGIRLAPNTNTFSVGSANIMFEGA